MTRHNKNVNYKSNNLLVEKSKNHLKHYFKPQKINTFRRDI